MNRSGVGVGVVAGKVDWREGRCGGAVDFEEGCAVEVGFVN